MVGRGRLGWFPRPALAAGRPWTELSWMAGVEIGCSGRQAWMSYAAGRRARQPELHQQDMSKMVGGN